MSDLEEILISLYASEINASISWIWDGDIDVKLGDPLNGYKPSTARSRASATTASSPGKPFSRSTARASAPPDSALQDTRPLAGTRTSGSVSVAKGDGSRLRTGLATGGRWIRTFGSPTDPLPLGDWFDEAIIGMRYCVQIRNQYAHRNFYENSLGKLAFVNLEELAKRNEIVNDYLSLAIRYVTPTLLEEQEQYFVYVRGTIGFLNYEGRFRSGKIKANPLSPPEKLIQPPHALEISH
jgi:hypothetical protein